MPNKRIILKLRSAALLLALLFLLTACSAADSQPACPTPAAPTAEPLPPTAVAPTPTPAPAGSVLMQQREVGDVLFQTVHKCVGIIAAAVFNHNDLGAEGLFGKKSVDLGQRGGQALGFVVSRDDEREQRIGC